MQKITPCLWFKDEAEEAVDFYVSIFPGARKGAVLRNDKVGAGAGGVVMVSFELFGQSFQALNGNNEDSFNNSISLSVDCKDQAEVDAYWDKLIGDRGRGIAADRMPRLFESFFSTRRDGMGLGLSIARSIVTSHGGYIWAENNLERGAAFHFTIPVDDSEAATESAGSAGS